MFAHWRFLREKLGNLVPIVGGTLEGIIKEQGMIPNFRARFCTRLLKIEPYAAWLLKQSQVHDEIYSYVGIRADEEEREAGDYTSVPGVKMVFPLREWGWKERDVWDYLARIGVSIPKRTDCALCFYQRIGEFWDLWKDFPEEYQKGVEIEERMGHTFRSPSRDTWPASLADLKERFEKGDVPRGAGVQEDLLGQRCRVCRL